MNNRWFGWACVGIMLLAGVLALPALPEQVSIHWNVQGQVDGYGPRWMAVVFLPVIGVFVIVLFRILTRFDPISRNGDNAAIMGRFANWIVLFLLMLHVATLANALNMQVDINLWVMVAVGVLFVAIGNEMGRLKPNSWAGIRLPWTISDEDVWRKSNRMGGRSLVVAGLVWIVSGLTLSPPADFIIATSAMLAALIFMIGYSYWAAQQKRRSLNR